MTGLHDEDRALVASCLTGDESAWRRLHGELSPFCREVVRSALRRARVAGVETEVDEATQDFFAYLAEAGGRRLGLYRDEGPLRHYVAVLATHFARAHAEKVMRRRHREQPIGCAEPVAAAADATIVLERAEARAQLEAAVATLSASDRLLFELVYRDGVEVETICRILHVTPNALYIRKARLKERMRTALGGSLAQRAAPGSRREDESE